MVRGGCFGGEGVVGTIGSRARLGLGHPGEGAGTSVHALSGWIRSCVRTELRAHRGVNSTPTNTARTELHTA